MHTEQVYLKFVAGDFPYIALIPKLYKQYKFIQNMNLV